MKKSVKAQRGVSGMPTSTGRRISRPFISNLLAVITLTAAPVSLLYGQGEKPQYSPETMAILEQMKQAQAQKQVKVKADVAVPEQAIDAELFLSSPLVLAEQLQGRIWTVNPREGRQLIAVPIDFSDIKGEVELRDPELKLKTGRFICWYIQEEVQQANQGNARRGSSNRNRQTYPQGGMDMEMAMMMGGMEMEGMPQRAPRQSKPMPNQRLDVQEEIKEAEIAEDAPRISKHLVVRPDGSVTWGLEKNIVGAEIADTQSLFAFKLDSKLLADQRPLRAGEQKRSSSSSRSRGTSSRSRSSSSRSSRSGGGMGSEMGGMPPGMGGGSSRSSRPTRSRATTSRSSGNSRAADREKQRQAQISFKRAMDDYRVLQEDVRALPSRFTLSKPAQIWAIYDLPLSVDDVTSTTEPEWTLSFSDLETLQSSSTMRGNSNNRSRENGANPVAYQLATDLSRLASKGNPFIDRLVANALSNSGSLPNVEKNDSIYRLAAQLIESDDALTRKPVIGGLSEAVPPTEATLSLLSLAADAMGSEEQLLALRSLVTVDVQNPIAVKQMLEMANRVLSDNDGPNPAKALDEILLSSEQAPNAEEISKILIHGLNFESLSAKRLDEAVRFIASQAAESKIAAGWVNHRLLGSPNAELPKKTLRTIDAIASPKSELMDKATTKLLSSLLGKKKSADEDKTDIAADAVGMTQIPILTPSHNLFRALNSGDDVLKKLAWKSLRHFVIGEPAIEGMDQKRNSRGSRYGNTRKLQDEDSLSEVYTLLLEAAIRQSDTPDGIAYFFAKQSLEYDATRALVRLVIDGDDSAALEAAIKLRGSQRSLDQIFEILNVDERERFASRMYESLDKKVPLVVGLMRDADEKSVIGSWFAEELMSSGLPDAMKFAEVYGNDDALLQLAGQKDQKLASGAVAALVAAAGGNEEMQERMATTIISKPDRSYETLRDFWSSAKREIHTRSLEKVAGTYTLILIVRGEENAKKTSSRRRQSEYDEMSMEMAMSMEMEMGMEMGGPGGPGGYSNARARSRRVEKKSTFEESPILREITIGSTALIVEAGSAHFDNDLVFVEVPDDFLGLRISNLNDLKNYEVKELDEIDFDQTDDSGMDLRVQKSGEWRGQTRMLDGKVLELIMKPASE
ncbi:hypothetical protein KS4_02770 [Poriferisphaera corsica]|uniref:Uncharacterized protein n=1 Tax=Poriferisphaera corsica TaxID=2528020 RepID=A0A517YPV5_9BACT|nr:hypothetical protein [Poriferisphaera corsica]QDU32246.1 hypothetical protein KS4_02770 [Poriferisphaera corsica]